MTVQTANLGKVQPIFRGEFTPSPPFNYKPTDQLTYAGTLYVAKQESDGSFLPTNTTYFSSVSGVDSIRLNSVVAFAISQYANGDDTKVAAIVAGLPLADYDYFIDANTYQVFSKNEATGAFSNPLVFDPTNGTDSGITGSLKEVSEHSNPSTWSKTIAMTAGDKTLTNVENTYARLVLTGTIGADRELIVSSSERNITVVNNTDDGFQVKVVTSSGTGVHVQNDCSYNLRCDGTNVLTLQGCKLNVLPTGSYAAGSFSFPNSLSESAFYSLELTGGGAATDYRNSTIITKDQIGTSGTGFNYTRAYVYTDAGDWARINRADEFSYSIANSTLFLNSIKGILNEGVTY